MAFERKINAKLTPLNLEVIGIFVILSGIFLYWAAQDIPLPKNAKQVGHIIRIDLSEGATDEHERKEASFDVPDKFKLGISEANFAFYFKFPDGTPYTGNDFPQPPDQIRVVVKHHAKAEGRSEYILQHTQPKGGTFFATPWFEENKNGLDIYRYRINSTAVGTYFNFVAKDGANVLVEDAGDWAKKYEINRKFSSHIELNYLIPKPLIRDSKHFVEDVTAIDKAALKLVQSFQSK